MSKDAEEKMEAALDALDNSWYSSAYNYDQAREKIHTLYREAIQERDRLQKERVASVDRWMNFLSHFHRLVRSNMGTGAGQLAIGYFKEAAAAGNFDEDGPPDVASLP